MYTDSIALGRLIRKKGQLLLFIAALLAVLQASEAWASTPKIDFNQDGCSDIAIGAPDASVFVQVNSLAKAGTVTVIYGDSDCPNPRPGTQLWHEGLRSIPGDPAAGDQFGYALATADFNGDGATDLAIGVPGKSIVVVLQGSPRGLRGAENPCLMPCVHQPKILRMAQPQTGDRFGASLAVGFFNLDKYPDLAVGAPEYDSLTAVGTGAVGVFYGSFSGLPVLSSIRLRSRTLLQQDYDSDHFGFSLAAGNFNGDGATDLAIGIPNKYTDDGRGAVAVVYGGATGLIPELRQDVPGHYQMLDFSDTGTFGDPGSENSFGWSLAAGDFGNNHTPYFQDRYGLYDDLAIGIPGDGSRHTGAVLVLYGDRNGLSTTDRTLFRAGNSAQGAVPQDNFGFALATGNFGYEEWDDLAVGVPGHPVQGHDAAGVVRVWFGSSVGLQYSPELLLKMDSAQTGARFGEVLSAAHLGGDNRADLVIGVPHLSETLKEVGGVLVRYGSKTGPALSTSDVLWTTFRLGLCCSEAFAHFGGAVSK